MGVRGRDEGLGLILAPTGLGERKGVGPLFASPGLKKKEKRRGEGFWGAVSNSLERCWGKEEDERGPNSPQKRYEGERGKKKEDKRRFPLLSASSEGKERMMEYQKRKGGITLSASAKEDEVGEKGKRTHQCVSSPREGGNFSKHRRFRTLRKEKKKKKKRGDNENFLLVPKKKKSTVPRRHLHRAVLAEKKQGVCLCMTSREKAEGREERTRSARPAGGEEKNSA